MHSPSTLLMTTGLSALGQCASPSHDACRPSSGTRRMPRCASIPPPIPQSIQHSPPLPRAHVLIRPLTTMSCPPAGPRLSAVGPTRGPARTGCCTPPGFVPEMGCTARGRPDHMPGGEGRIREEGQGRPLRGHSSTIAQPQPQCLAPNLPPLSAVRLGPRTAPPPAPPPPLPYLLVCVLHLLQRHSPATQHKH